MRKTTDPQTIIEHLESVDDCLAKSSKIAMTSSKSVSNHLGRSGPIDPPASLKRSCKDLRSSLVKKGKTGLLSKELKTKSSTGLLDVNNQLYKDLRGGPLFKKQDQFQSARDFRKVSKK